MKPELKTPYVRFTEDFLNEVIPEGKEVIIQVKTQKETVTLENLEEANSYFVGFRQAMEYAGAHPMLYGTNKIIEYQTSDIIATLKYFIEK